MILKNFILKEYELNEQYHDTKEKSLWVAFALYYTYCVASTGYFLEIYNRNNYIRVGPLVVLINILIFVLFSLFIEMQGKRKCISVLKSTELNRIITSGSNYEIKRWFEYEQKELEIFLLKKYRKKLLLVCRIEIVLCLLMVIMFFSNIAAILYASNVIASTSFIIIGLLFISALFSLSLACLS